jgi:hemerythrin-like domain-containing protein
MGPTQTLRREHEAVCLVVNAADRKAAAIAESGRLDGEWTRGFVEFSRRFTDGCHHTKEERHLFARLQEKAPEETRAIVTAMLAEHEGGRERVRRLLEHLEAAERGDEAAIALVAEQLSAYSGLLRSHIAKENNVLFPLADRLLAEDDTRALDEAFEDVESSEMGEGEHERLHALAERLGEGVGDITC